MNTYFRITAYHPALDISFIIDSVNQYNAIWEFSADLVSKKCKILYVSQSQQFDNGNIPLAKANNDCYILRACMYGKVEAQNGVVNIKGRYYTPNMGR
jgi:hypothetical protein